MADERDHEGRLAALIPELVDDSSALADDAVVREVMAEALSRIIDINAYRHENGFVKITVAATELGQVRVHVWDRRRPQEDAALSVHSHRHPICSRVVQGSFLEERWRESHVGDVYRRYSFTPQAHGETELAESGSIYLVKSLSKVRKRGEVYSIPVGDFHCIWPVSVPTVTVVVQDLREFADGEVAVRGLAVGVVRPPALSWEDRCTVRDILRQSLTG